MVLGNEREGIPTNIISLLDVVLEIPQKGIIRTWARQPDQLKKPVDRHVTCLTDSLSIFRVEN